MRMSVSSWATTDDDVEKSLGAMLGIAAEGVGAHKCRISQGERALTKKGRARVHRLPPSVLDKSRELRHPLTPPEKELWRRLRDHQLGFHIRRQHVLLGRYIADFYCADARLCIEVDGDSHAEPDQIEYDAARTRALETEGYRVMRFTNRDVFRDLKGVLETITQACKAFAA